MTYTHIFSAVINLARAAMLYFLMLVGDAVSQMGTLILSVPNIRRNTDHSIYDDIKNIPSNDQLPIRMAVQFYYHSPFHSPAMPRVTAIQKAITKNKELKYIDGIAEKIAITTYGDTETFREIITMKRNAARDEMIAANIALHLIGQEKERNPNYMNLLSATQLYMYKLEPADCQWSKLLPMEPIQAGQNKYNPE